MRTLHCDACGKGIAVESSVGWITAEFVEVLIYHRHSDDTRIKEETGTPYECHFCSPECAAQFFAVTAKRYDAEEKANEARLAAIKREDEAAKAKQ